MRKSLARPLRRVALVLLVAAFSATCAVGEAAASTPTPQSLRARADEAATGLLAYPFVSGRVMIPNGFNRVIENFHAGALAYSWLRAAERSSDQVLAARLIRSANSAITWSIRTYDGSPFALFSLAKALPVATRLSQSQPGAATIASSIATFLRTVGPSSVKPGRTCSRDDSCYTNWSLVRAVGIAALLASNPPGVPAPGSYLADPAGDRAWVRELLEQKVPAARGPATAGWSDGRPGCVLSDPPSNPHAYHVFSTWLLSQLAVDAPAWSETRTSSPIECTRRMLAMIASPDGDLAWSGRSQLQSWNLAAGILAAAYAARDDGDPMWSALAERLWDRLSSDDYTDPVDRFFAVTPSARQRTLLGLDGYVDPSQYNGLTMMLLNIAADAIADSPLGAASGIPADSDGGLVEPVGLHSVIERSGNVWWIWRTDNCGTDLRCDSGILQVKVRGPGGWVNLLSARPKLGSTGVIGPNLSVAGRTASFVATSAETNGATTVLHGSFGNPALGRKADLTVTATDRGLRISWPVGRLQTYFGAFPLVSAARSSGGFTSPSGGISFSPQATLSAPTAGASALSAATTLNRWRFRTSSAGVATIAIESSG